VNTVDDEALAVEYRSVFHAYALKNTQQAKNTVVTTPQWVELPLYANYRGEGEL
jgi:hypothetical protein